MSKRLAGIVEEVAAARGVRTVDTNAPFWADSPGPMVERRVADRRRSPVGSMSI